MVYFIDTGVLLRLFDDTDPHHHAIRRAIRVLRSQGHTLVTSAQNIAEFWNVSTRPTTARGGYGQSLATTDRRVKLIERFGPILSESSAAYQHWRLIVVAQAVTGVAVHDARLVAIMRVAGITNIVTLNQADFHRYPGVVAILPQDILAPQSQP